MQVRARARIANVHCPIFSKNIGNATKILQKKPLQQAVDYGILIIHDQKQNCNT